jgi:hypothetical protein
VCGCVGCLCVDGGCVLLSDMSFKDFLDFFS